MSKYKTDFSKYSLQEILDRYYPGATSLSEAVAMERNKSTSEIEKREKIRDRFIKEVEEAHAKNPGTTIPKHLETKLKMVLKKLARPLMELNEKEFIENYEEWKDIWLEAMKFEERDNGW